MPARPVGRRRAAIRAAEGSGFARQILRVALLLLAIMVTLNSALTVASTAASPPRIAVLLYNSLLQHGGPEHPVILGLRDVGLVDGKTANILVREAEGNPDRLPQLAAELVAQKPDVIITAGPQPIAAVKNATNTIPIVMAIVSDPVTYGFVDSLSRPGGSLTGLSMVNTELSSKRLELLKEVAPHISRVAVFTDPTMGPQGLVETDQAASLLGLKLQILSLTADKIKGGFIEAREGRAEALLVMPTPFYNIPEVRRQLGAAAIEHRLPSMCEEISYVIDGCLLSYGPDFPAMWRRSAVYVEKILKGAKPGDIPVEQPTQFNFFVNKKTADAIGLPIPQSILVRANDVIER
jgi:putative tryptophan/tyrosine transport system substrate-binding protein